MRENHLFELAYSISHAHSKAGCSHELRTWITYHMHTNNGFVLLVHNHLAQSRFSLILSHKATRISHWQLVYFVFHKRFIKRHRRCKVAFANIVQILLCQSNACNLRVGINHTWDSVVGNTLQWQLLEHTSHSHFGLTTCHMCQHNLTRHIACGIYILEISFHKLIYHNTPTIQLYIVQCLQSLHIRTATYRNEDMLCLVFAIGGQHFITL